MAVVTETMARFYFPGASAIGRTIRFDDSTAARIIGVIADTKDHSLEQAPVRRIYLAYDQHAVGATESLNLEIRTTGAPGAVGAAVRREIAAVDALLPINSVAPLSLLMYQSIHADRLVTRLAGGFGVLALLLAALGLYGVMAYAVTRRTGEIGLRAALGAQRGDIVHMVLGDAWRLVALGVAASVPLVFLAMRLLRTQLSGVSAPIQQPSRAPFWSSSRARRWRRSCRLCGRPESDRWWHCEATDRTLLVTIPSILSCIEKTPGISFSPTFSPRTRDRLLWFRPTRSSFSDRAGTDSSRRSPGSPG